MGTENQKQTPSPKQKQNEEPLAQPSEAPLKNEPTPERAHEEKAKQERKACP